MPIGVIIAVVLICIIVAVILLRKKKGETGGQPKEDRFKACPNCGSYLCDGQKCQPSDEPTAHREVT